MIGTLVQGRVSLDGASVVVASKLALTIAIRYGSERRQFADAHGGDERSCCSTTSATSAGC